MAGREIEVGPVGEAVAKAVRARRERLGWALVTLSERMERAGRRIPPNGLANLEARRRRVDVDDLVALAAVLDTTPHDLMGWSDPADLEGVENPRPEVQDEGVPLSRESLAEVARVAREEARDEFARLVREMAEAGFRDPEKAAAHELASKHFQQFGAPWETPMDEGAGDGGGGGGEDA